MPRLLSASALPEGQSNNLHFKASEKQAVQEKKKILFKEVSETLFSHLEIKENMPVNVSVSIHFSSLLDLSLPDIPFLCLPFLFRFSG